MLRRCRKSSRLGSWPLAGVAVGTSQVWDRGFFRVVQEGRERRLQEGRERDEEKKESSREQERQERHEDHAAKQE